jgi:hypothetical protein
VDEDESPRSVSETKISRFEIIQRVATRQYTSAIKQQRQQCSNNPNNSKALSSSQSRCITSFQITRALAHRVSPRPRRDFRGWPSSTAAQQHNLSNAKEQALSESLLPHKAAFDNCCVYSQLAFTKCCKSCESSCICSGIKSGKGEETLVVLIIVMINDKMVTP